MRTANACRPFGKLALALTADGRVAQGNVRVSEDPGSRASSADLRQQLGFLLRVRAQIILMTKAIERLKDLEKKNPGLRPRVDDLLRQLYNPGLTESEDALREPEQLYGQLSYLASEVAVSDAAPTESEYAVLIALEERARVLLAQADAIE